MNNTLIVEFIEDNCEFKIYDNNRNFIGKFTNVQLIKYLTSKINSAFLNDISISSCSNVIELYVCNIYEIDDNIKINLHDHIKSPFMGNIEMMMKLYKEISIFDNKNLLSELDKLPTHDIKERKRITAVIKQFSYLLLNHMLKLIATISDAIKNDYDKKNLKEMLLKYSAAVVYKLSNFMKHEIEIKIDDYKIVQNDLVRLSKIKLEMYKKIDDLQKSVKLQEQQINLLMTHANVINNISGGAHNISTATTSTTVTGVSNSSTGSTNVASGISSVNNSSTGSSRSANSTNTSSETSSRKSSSKSNFMSNLSENFDNSDCYFTESYDESGNSISYITSNETSKDSSDNSSSENEIQSLKYIK